MKQATNIETKIKTIDINAKEWFDKVNGNSYFAGRIIINFGLSDEKSFYMPFQYGYGTQYENVAFSLLFSKGLTSSKYGYDLRETDGIIIRSHIETGCKKKELKAFGELIER